MPTYQYRCSQCKKQKTLIHAMRECDNPNKDIIGYTTCCGKRMIRVPQYISFNEFSLLSKQEQSKRLANRSKEDNIKRGNEEASEAHSDQIRKQFS